jgi:hypothetical protein
MHAPPKSDYPIAEPHDLEKYDAFLFGIPTRYGNFPAQWKAFWDKTGGQWQSGAYWGKYAGVFVSTGTPGGGQESTVIASMSTMTHHGIIYVPLGYKTAFPLLADLSEARGGSPWGAGTFAVHLALLFRNSPSPYAYIMLIPRKNRAWMVPANPPPRNSNSPKPKESPSTKPSPKSTSHD